jgi:uncharacterized membrane protein
MNRWLGLSIALTIAAFALSGYVFLFLYDRLPDPMPTHWNIEGEPDAWQPRSKGFFMNFLLTPTVMAGMVGLTLALPWLSPKNFKIDTWRDTYYYIMALVVALFGFIHVCLVLSTLDPGLPFVRFMVAGMMFFFALMGNVLGRVRRNFYVGVRTPWTLASDVVWNQTHRVAAWLFVAFGLAGAVAALAGVNLIVCFVALTIAVLTPVVYSLVLYKRLERQGRL